jgi:hypothetical protein
MGSERPDYILAHEYCSSNKESIMKSDLCGCFYCLAIFTHAEIYEWIPDKKGDTALCPKCGIDSVIGSDSNFPMKKEFLNKMKQYWF